MVLTIFDVEHGFCAYIIADTNNVMMIDCGHNNVNGFKPSDYLRISGCNGIERFVVSNYDGDHLSDLPNLYAKIPIQILHRNNSVSGEQLKKMKLEKGPLKPGIITLLQMIDKYTGPVTNPPSFGELNFEMFFNNYPDFEDTNNLSLVTFIQYRDINIIFPGDLEKQGWHKLLENQKFCDRLTNVNAFVASHHGRENGYCPEVFDFCKPEIVIISDEPIKYDTQKDFYSKHASGVKFSSETRYVLTTRSDGHITLTQNLKSSPKIHCGKFR